MTFHSIANLIFGMVFAWLVLSLAAMYLQEMVAAKLRWRQKMLETTIRNMLVDSAYADQFYNHPLIRSLYSGSEATSKPSYIPSDQFARALIDILMASGSEASLIQQQLYKLLTSIDFLEKKQRQPAQEQLGTILALTRRVLVSEASSADNAEAIRKIKDVFVKLGNDFPGLKSAIENSLATIERQKEQISAVLNSQTAKANSEIGTASNKIQAGIAVLAVTNPGLKQTLQSLINGYIETSEQSEEESDSLSHMIEMWFSDSMDRLTGWYKRRAQVLSIVLGILLGVTANVDSLQLANYLWREPLVGNALAVQAENYIELNQGELQSPTANQLIMLQDQLNKSNLPFGWLGSPIYILSDGPAAAPVCTRTPQSGTDIYGVSLANLCYPIINAPQPDNTTGWIFKGVGLLITGLATSKGAPFWFDVLNKIINVRLAGVNPSELQSAFG
jgi:uncharacterized protein YlxW (UPF0749 family)